jgi:hypothetical protein
MNEVVVDGSTNRASPAVAGVDVGLPVEQQSHDLPLPLAGGDVQRGASVEVDAVDVHSRPEQLLHPGGVPLAGDEEQPHRGVQVLRHGQVVRGPAAHRPRRRVQRRLSGDREPRGRRPSAARRRVRVQRQLAPHPRRPRRELPRDAPRHLLRRRVHRYRSLSPPPDGVGRWASGGVRSRGCLREAGVGAFGDWGRMIGRRRGENNSWGGDFTGDSY